MLILPPIELCDYIEFENDRVVAVKEIPEELRDEFEIFKKSFEAAYENKHL